LVVHFAAFAFDLANWRGIRLFCRPKHITAIMSSS